MSVLGVETVGGLRGLRLSPACKILETRHHGLLTDGGEEDEDTLRLRGDIS